MKTRKEILSLKKGSRIGNWILGVSGDVETAGVIGHGS